jgi:hypothetical protein
MHHLATKDWCPTPILHLGNIYYPPLTSFRPARLPEKRKRAAKRGNATLNPSSQTTVGGKVGMMLKAMPLAGTSDFPVSSVAIID